MRAAAHSSATAAQSRSVPVCASAPRAPSGPSSGPSFAINMGQGFPDFAGSAVARDAAKAALDVPALNQYAPINGLLARSCDGADRSATRALRFTLRGRRSGRDDVGPGSPSQPKRITEERRAAVVMEPFYPFLAPAIAAAGRRHAARAA